MFKINKWFLVFVFAVFVNFVAILFYMNARDGMHVDEQFSYGHSNSSRGGFIFDGIDHHFGDSKDINNKWIDANIYMNYFSVSSKNRFSYGNIVENLRKDVHPPLYYVILHTISSVFYGEFNKWFGLGINLVLFWLIAFGIYKLNKLIIGDDKYALVCFCLWGMSNIGVSTILFIRMYALQTFLLTMLIYETGKIVKENRVSNSGLFLVFLYSALGILTQYNSIFFSFFLAVSTGCVLLIRKNYSLLIKYSIVMLLSILTLFIVFEPAYDVLLKSQRSKGAFENSLFMLEDPLLIFDMEFYRFLKIFLYDFWNIDNSINFVLLSMVIIVFRWFNFRKYLLKDKKIKVLCNLSFIMLLFFAFLGPIGALFLLFLFEKSKYLILKVENKEKIDGEKAKSQYIIGWSLGCILPSTIFIFVIMPFMGEYETRYIMAIMPFVTVLNIYILIKTGNYFKLTKNKLYVFLLCLVIFNGMITNFYKESVFRFRNTIETNNFMKNIKNKDVFVVSHEKEPLLFFERGYYLKDAKRVYLEPKLTDENLIKEINNNRQDMYVLVLEQSYIDSFWGKPSFMEKNPRMKDVLKFVSKIVLSERGYDLYQIK